MGNQAEAPAEPIKFTGKGPVHYFPATEGIVVGSPVVLKGLVNSDHVRKLPCLPASHSSDIIGPSQSTKPHTPRRISIEYFQR